MRGKAFLVMVPVALVAGCGNSSGGGTVGSLAAPSDAPVASEPSVPDPTITDAPATEAPVSLPPPVATTPPVSAVTQWATGGGLEQIKTLTLDFGAINVAGNNADAAATRQACVTLTADAAKAQTYAPVPLASAQTHWATALSEFESAGTDCTAGLDATDENLISKSVDELNAGGGELSAANKLILAAP